MEINQLDIVLCEFYSSDLRQSKKRPVLVFKDNLPHDDFVAMPISSKVEKLYTDEMILSNEDLSQGFLPVTSKIMTRKTFVVSKQSVIKKYGTVKNDSFIKYLEKFCHYFGCTNE